MRSKKLKALGFYRDKRFEGEAYSENASSGELDVQRFLNQDVYGPQVFRQTRSQFEETLKGVIITNWEYFFCEEKKSEGLESPICKEIFDYGGKFYLWDGTVRALERPISSLSELRLQLRTRKDLVPTSVLRCQRQLAQWGFACDNYKVLDRESTNALPFLVDENCGSYAGSEPIDLMSISFLSLERLKAVFDASDSSLVLQIKNGVHLQLISQLCSDAAYAIRVRALYFYQVYDLFNFDFGIYTNLEDIMTNNSEGLDFSKLGNCQKLKTLTIVNHDALFKLPDFSACPNLKEVALYCCAQLTDIKGLENNPCLRTLLISKCAAISRLPNFNTCPNLENVSLSGCRYLTEDVIVELRKKYPELKIVRLPGVELSSTDLVGVKSVQERKSVDATCNMDFDTFFDPNTMFHARELFVDYRREHPPVNGYRKDVFNEVVLSERNLQLQLRLSYAESELESIGELRRVPHISLLPKILNERQYWGEVPLDLTNDSWTVLPSLNPYDELCVIESDVDLEIKWCAVSSQYLVKLKGSESCQIKLRYIMEMPAVVSRVPSPKLISLPEIIQQGLKIALHCEPLQTLAKQIAEAGGITERIRLLQVYCSHFDFTKALSEDKKLTAKLTPLDLTSACIDLFKMLIQHRGVCRHSSYAFLVLGISFNIPCRIISNGVHVFVEVWENSIWEKLDLGGAPASLEIERLPLNFSEAVSVARKPPSKELVDFLNKPDFTQSLEVAATSDDLCTQIIGSVEMVRDNILLRGIDEILAPVFYLCVY